MMTRSNGRSSGFRNWLNILRIPNLAMIIITQYLLGYGIIRPLLKLHQVEAPLGHLNFFMLVMTTLLIAAAGYIINDHFDVNTDRKNKPGKNMLEGKISVRKALNAYYIINAVAILLGFYLAYLAASFQLGLVFPAIIGLLWYYSSRYQRMPFWGNLIVALLSAMVLLVIWLFEFYILLKEGADFVSVIRQLGTINSFVWAYALFAFLLSLTREVLKDIQDVKGDMTSGYRTLPVIWGLKRARVLAGGLIIISIILLAAAQWILFSKGMDLASWYLLIAVQSLLIYLLYQLARAKESDAYGFLSNMAKLIMLAGILSMELIYISI
ncbi:MAG: geranylgeranylglycerol-phosphate geranylgeranyltransferase [Bacteroidota bacterium]